MAKLRAIANTATNMQMGIKGTGSTIGFLYFSFTKDRKF